MFYAIFADFEDLIQFPPIFTDVLEYAELQGNKKISPKFCRLLENSDFSGHENAHSACKPEPSGDGTFTRRHGEKNFSDLFDTELPARSRTAANPLGLKGLDCLLSIAELILLLWKR